jgi:D-alanine-D-alanine ligase
MARSPTPTRIGVIYNAYVPVRGRGTESASERAVEQAAREAAHALAKTGAKPTLIPVAGNLAALVRDLTRRRLDALVNLCEGFGGKPALEAHVAALLEISGLPFTGNTARTILICQDKFRAKRLLAAAGVRVAAGWLAESVHDVPRAAGFPLIVKPNAEDASIGVRADSVVRTRDGLAARIAHVLRRYRQPALVERFLDGREFNIGVLDGPTGPRTLPISEIPFTNFPPGEPRIVGYEAKWQPSHALYRLTTPVCPARVAASLARELNAMALHAWRALDLRGYGRVDFRTDDRGRAHVLEVNPNPDTSLDAGLARALNQAGIPYPDFWRGQVALALRYARG